MKCFHAALGLVVASQVVEGFNLPRTQESAKALNSQRAGANEIDNTSTRRSFIETAGAIVGASFLSSSQKANALDVGGKIVFGDESIMRQKAHGTSEKPVQSDLLYGVSNKLADKITNYNRQFAEMAGYFRSTSFEDIVLEAKGPITFYDSVTGQALFVAPIGRSAEDFVSESEVHGWPSFRDQEVGVDALVQFCFFWKTALFSEECV